MEPKFQTSFIPKKQAYPAIGGIGGAPAPKVVHHGTSIFMSLAILLFVVSLGSVGGVYLWKQYLVKAQEDYKTELAKNESQFKLELIEQLKKANTQIDQARQILRNHVAISQVFAKVLQPITVINVRFLSMELKGAAKGSGLDLTMKGYGSNLATVAFQSDVLGKLSQYGLSNIVKDPALSDPLIDAKGVVSFGLSASVDQDSLLYKQEISPAAGSSGTAPSTN